VCIEGFEVDGNADQLQQNGINEPGSHVIQICSSSNVVVRNVRIHNGWTDAISVRAKDYLAPEEEWRACQTIVIENCDLHGNVRAGIGIHEARNVRISDCRIYDNGMGVDIEPDLWIGTSPVPGDQGELRPFDVNIRPQGRRDLPGWSWLTLLDNCQVFDCDKPFSVAVKYSHVVIRGCFIDNARQHAYPLIMSVPHCTIVDSEIDAGTGSVSVGLTHLIPGRTVFTMERCLVRSHTRSVNGVLTTGHGLFLTGEDTDVGTGDPAPRVLKALIANNHFINESVSPWSPDGTDGGTALPNISHGLSALQITFRDNLVFLPQQAHYRYANPATGPDYLTAVRLCVQLAENNVYVTDLDVADAYFQVYYSSDVAEPPKYPVAARNERFIAPGDGKGIRPADNTAHDNRLPFHIP